MVYLVHGTFWRGHKLFSALGTGGCRGLKLETLTVGDDLPDGLPQRILAYAEHKTNQAVGTSRPGKFFSTAKRVWSHSIQSALGFLHQ